MRRAIVAAVLPLTLITSCDPQRDSVASTLGTVGPSATPVHPGDKPCVNGRPDEVGAPFPANDVYVDSHVVTWSTTDPEQVALDSSLLENGVREAARAPTLLSLLVARHGKLVVEEYFHGAESSHGRNLHSATKSLLALLVGAAIDDGILSGIDVPIGDLLSEAEDSELASVTVEQLLSMSGGLDSEVEGEPTWVSATVELPLVFEPGSEFRYNSGESELVALALDRLVGGGLCGYAHDRLLGTLGIDVDHWHVNPEANVSGGQAAFMTPRELARIGQLVLDGGRWEDRQVVSSQWLATMLEPRFELGCRPTGRTSYALHWWIFDIGGQRVWTAAGYGGQFLQVIPALDMVVVVTHDTGGPLQRTVPSADLLRGFVIPAAGDPAADLDTAGSTCPAGDLFRARVDGSEQEQLAPHPANDVGGDWSLDGTQIAFHSFRDLNAELYIMNADGSRLRRLTQDWAADAAPRWSPDGDRLVFMSDRSAPYFEDIPALDVHVIDLASGEIRLLTEGMGDVRAVSWAPDGERIAFVRSKVREGVGDLWVVGANGGAADLLFEGEVGYPSWSPDGTRIAVTTLGPDADDSWRVQILDLRSGKLNDLGPGNLPSWSPDGRRVFATTDTERGPTLAVVDIEDGSHVLVDGLPGGTVSPDGEWVLFNEAMPATSSGT